MSLSAIVTLLATGDDDLFAAERFYVCCGENSLAMFSALWMIRLEFAAKTAAAFCSFD
jgi:hypothetical protein